MIIVSLTFVFLFSAWIKVAGICGVATIVALGLFSLFSILHVAMQLQRKEIWISFKRDVFAKLVTASLAGNFISISRSAHPTPNFTNPREPLSHWLKML